MRCSSHCLNTACAITYPLTHHPKRTQILPATAISDRREAARGVKILILGERYSKEASGSLTWFAEDGGGASGLSSLVILAEGTDRLQRAAGLAGPPNIRDHFDIVAGTGTGA
jgi:hypothetical protein